MTALDLIINEVSKIKIPDFFVTVECTKEGNERPKDIETFLFDKYHSIINGAKGRKYIYTDNEWRLIFTFFPTDGVVDERYALKNKVQMKTKAI